MLRKCEKVCQMFSVRCGRALLQSAVVADLLVVQVLEGEPVAEG